MLTAKYTSSSKAAAELTHNEYRRGAAVNAEILGTNPIANTCVIAHRVIHVGVHGTVRTAARAVHLVHARAVDCAVAREVDHEVDRRAALEVDRRAARAVHTVERELWYNTKSANTTMAVETMDETPKIELRTTALQDGPPTIHEVGHVGLIYRKNATEKVRGGQEI